MHRAFPFIAVLWALLNLGVPVPTLGQEQEEMTQVDSFAVLAANARQHVLVVMESMTDTWGSLHRMERRPGVRGGEDTWQRIGRPLDVVVGLSGVGPKREGDNRSPQGVFEFGSAFGYTPEPPWAVLIPYEAMPPGAVCVDDTLSAFYNQIVDPTDLPEGERQDWATAEEMRRDLAFRDELYRWGVVVRYNDLPATPGGGSCIFLHIWRDPESPTEGCTAMSPGDLLAVMRWLDPAAEPVLVQGDRYYLEYLAEEGVLPYPLPRNLPE